MLLVYDDQAGIPQRKEHGGTRAQHDAGRRVAPQGIDHPIALGNGCLGMENQQTVAEDVGDPLLQLLGNGDFGDKIQDVTPLPQLLRSQMEINLRLAAPGDAGQQHGLPCGKSAADPLQRGALRLG